MDEAGPEAAAGKTRGSNGTEAEATTTEVEADQVSIVLDNSYYLYYCITNGFLNHHDEVFIFDT